jgi:hypothetical protein
MHAALQICLCNRGTPRLAFYDIHGRRLLLSLCRSFCFLRGLLGLCPLCSLCSLSGRLLGCPSRLLGSLFLCSLLCQLFLSPPAQSSE